MHEDMDQQASSMIACVLTLHYCSMIACVLTLHYCPRASRHGPKGKQGLPWSIIAGVPCRRVRARLLSHARARAACGTYHPRQRTAALCQTVAADGWWL